MPATGVCQAERVPLDASLVGQVVGSVHITVDERRLMAFAAGVPDERPALYDTVGGLTVHPLFAVSPEWAVFTSVRAMPGAMSRDETLAGIHLDHDLLIDRPVKAGEELAVAATVVGVGDHRAGATQVVRFDATAAGGASVWRTRHTTLFLGVELAGPSASIEGPWPAPVPRIDPGSAPLAERTIRVGPLDAHVYTECAQIWNPIHTDASVARRAGLPGPILHGTATLARAVSAVADVAGVGLERVDRVQGHFGAMVDLDTDIVVAVYPQAGDAWRFEVRNAAGQAAIRHGAVTVGPG